MLTQLVAKREPRLFCFGMEAKRVNLLVRFQSIFRRALYAFILTLLATLPASALVEIDNWEH